MDSFVERQPGRFQRFIGKRALAEPAQIFNTYLAIGCLIFGTLGAARGFDEGNVSNMLNAKDFKQTFGLVVNAQHSKADVAATSGNIAGMVQLASIGGAAIAFVFTDRIGRVWALRQLCVFWILGVFLQIFSTHIGQLYAGRIIAGFGIGATTVVGPTYLVEIAPASIRGLCSGVFSGSVYIGIFLSYFASYGSKLHQTGRIAWQIPFLLQIVFAGISLGVSFFALESPRYLFMRGQDEKALVNMEKLRSLPRDHPYCVEEARRIKEGIETYKRAVEGKTIFRRMAQILATTANRYRLIGIGIASQTLSQFSGSSSITIFAPQFFELLGVTGDETKLFATALFGVVKLIASFVCALFLIDRIGRKRSVYAGISLQFLSMLYMAILTQAVPAISQGKIHTLGLRVASTIGIMSIYLNGIGWALGWNSVQYVLAAEIWPLELRALGNSFIMMYHFVAQYATSKATPTMFLSPAEGGITAPGTFFFFAAVCFLGLVYAYFFLPELAGHSLESMESIFSGPWWKIGRRFAKVEPHGAPAEHDNASRASSIAELPEKLEPAQHVEAIEPNSVYRSS